MSFYFPLLPAARDFRKACLEEGLTPLFVMARTHDGKTFRMVTIIDEDRRECLAIEVSRRFS